MFIILFSCWRGFSVNGLLAVPSLSTDLQMTNQRYQPAGSVYSECSHQRWSPRSIWGYSWWCRWWGSDWGWWRRTLQLRWKVCSPRQGSWKMTLINTWQHKIYIRPNTWNLNVPPCEAFTSPLSPAHHISPSKPRPDWHPKLAGEGEVGWTGQQRCRLRPDFFSRNIFSIILSEQNILQIYSGFASRLVLAQLKFLRPRNRNIDC